MEYEIRGLNFLLQARTWWNIAENLADEQPMNHGNSKERHSLLFFKDPLKKGMYNLI